MKVMTVVGTRPEIIRLSRVIEKLDSTCQHSLVHTGQNFEYRLSDIFFKELRIRTPNEYLGVQAETFGEQVGAILAAMESLLRRERPDALLVLGDTNSGLASIVAKRMGILVFHLEAGNRCYDDRVPEEVNRRLIDHSSTILMPYTHRSKENLHREGIGSYRIHVIGNPIFEVIQHYLPEIQDSTILERQQLEPKKYFLITFHRAENVDVEERLRQIVEALERLPQEFSRDVVCSLHPRTRNKMQQFGVSVREERVHVLDPLGFYDFLALERSALCVLTDSGTVQEECCILGVPAVTIRDVTERPETIDCGSNMLSGTQPDMILRCLHTVMHLHNSWAPPPEYVEPDVSSRVSKIVLGYSYWR